MGCGSAIARIGSQSLTACSRLTRNTTPSHICCSLQGGHETEKDEVACTDKPQQLKFVNKWKAKKEEFLNDVFRLENGPHFSFVTGILCATSSSKHLAPILQHVVQANCAHTSFGKYMLFSFSEYALTANGNMSPLSFCFLLENKDAKNWSKFWRFVTKVHPCIYSPEVTILTDQDKGSIAAIAHELQNFHCAFHRHQNIIKTLGLEKELLL